MSGGPIPETLLGLVQRYSPSGQEGEAVAYLVERMHQLGYSHSFVDAAGNAVGVMGEGRREVMLLGHIDTVPGVIPVRLEGDRLYGRGAVDAKGPLAAFVDATAECGPIDGWKFTVIGAVDEERDSLGAQYVARHYRPEMVIVGEPSRWERVTLGYKGSAWADIVVRRSLSHTASKEKSACELAVEVWQSIQEWAANFNQGRQQLFEQVQPMLRKMESGDDHFEEWARLRLGMRLPQDLPPAAWYEQLRHLTGAAEVTTDSFPIPAYRSDKNNPLVRALLAAIRAQGGQPGFVLKTGTADLNIVGTAWGCPAVAYGPGDSNLDHTPEEHILLSEYARSVEVLKGALERISGG